MDLFKKLGQPKGRMEESSSGTGAPLSPAFVTISDPSLTFDCATAHISKTNVSDSSARGGKGKRDDGGMDPEERRRRKRERRGVDVDIAGMHGPMDMLSAMRKHRDPDAKKLDSSRDLSLFSSTSQSQQPQQNCFFGDHGMNKTQWTPPEMVDPEEEAITELQDLGGVTADASLFSLTEKQTDGQEVRHMFLQMPSAIPQEMKNATRASTLQKNTLNILMLDGSGSMSRFFPFVISGWNSRIVPALSGRTKIFVFSSSVIFMREGTSEDTEGIKLKKQDFERGGTDLTGALQTIVDEVYKCKEKYVKVFLITDGAHNATSIQPDSVIDVMEPPRGKVCDVYVLGAGRCFPVQYSINMRSRLHSGSANLPSLFWAQTDGSTVEQMKDISQRISSSSSQSGTLSVSGSTLPGLPPKNTFYFKEWVYFTGNLDQLHEIGLTVDHYSGRLTLSPKAIDIERLKEVFQQWNSVIVQLHTKKANVPGDVIPCMERLFSAHMKFMRSGPAKSVRQRLQKKLLNTHETDFRTQLNKIKAILTTEKFQDELELAENILSTTVGGSEYENKSKYEKKSLQLKGHTDKDYKSACTAFMQVLNANKSKIEAIDITPEECCRITLSSTISDLQDPDFPMMMDLNKFDFLKTFTITGIPVFAPVRDSALLNPWSLSIRHLVGSPYTIMSQVAMESFAANVDLEDKNKQIQIKWDEKNTRFNAIVPVFPKDAVKIMEPIVRTELYAMCVTFGILKNPHIIDYNIHMASLGVTWVRILFEFPNQPRPEYVCERIESIMATAGLYVDRPAYAKYAAALRDDTAEALMTESLKEFEGKHLKCETLIKPMFMLYLLQKCQDSAKPIDTIGIVKLILSEYIGRCLSNYKAHEKNPTPYTDFFAEDFTDQKRTKAWLKKYIEDAKVNMAGSEVFLLKDFYTLEMVQKAAKNVASEEVKILKEKLTAYIPAKVNLEKIERLRSVSTAGDVSLPTLRTFARDVGLSTEIISDLFSEEAVFVYTYHALEYRSSRDRLSNPLPSYVVAKKSVLKNVESENRRGMSENLYTELVSHLQESWLKAYFAAHAEVVKPMSRTQIINEATRLGVQVTEATFDQVYKRYRDHLGLLGNACQCRACPYFLQPNKRYNQHAIVERRGRTAFPHKFHHVAYEHRDSDVSVAMNQIANGSYSKSQKPVPHEDIDKYSDDLQCLKAMYTELNTE